MPRSKEGENREETRDQVEDGNGSHGKTSHDWNDKRNRIGEKRTPPQTHSGQNLGEVKNRGGKHSR